MSDIWNTIDGTVPERSPLYEASHAARYERQKLIRQYQDKYNCRLIVLIGRLVPACVANLEETLYDARSDEDLHLLLGTAGGDGETALRIIRQAQTRCRKLTVIVPDQAKSAGTLLAIGADYILMGPTSDLGPIDPQIKLDSNRWVAAQDLIAAVEKAERRIQISPDVFPLYASLFEGISIADVALAQSAVARTGSLLKEALQSASNRDETATQDLINRLKGPLLDRSQSHGTTISAQYAKSHLGLPVHELVASEPQWIAIWRLWMRFIAVAQQKDLYGDIWVFEGMKASRIVGL